MKFYCRLSRHRESALGILLLLWLGLPGFSAMGAGGLPREVVSLDAGWKFYLGDDWGTGENLMKAGISTGPADPTFCDASFRTVDLPHDWAVELPFDKKADRSHGFKAIGKNFPENSIAWYRRTFTLATNDLNKRIWLDFDGVYRDCVVFVNGYRVGRHESGYDGFKYDITDLANIGGENVVAVRVDATKAEGWFYEGAGIYRHVWLEQTEPVAIAPEGVFVFCQFPNNTPGDRAEINAKTQVLNTLTTEVVTKVRQEVVDPAGEMVASKEQVLRIGAGLKAEDKATIPVLRPVLWSPESPRLYRLITTVTEGGQVVDRKETTFGIRTFAFDANRGFLLNGQPYEIKGTCNHQDMAGVGAAVPDALQDYRIAKLKEFGCNAYRTSHNAPTPELLDACDRLGMLVMDENRLLGSDAENMALLEGQIRRDRNHASVFIWSIANEEHVQASPASARIAETMQRDVHRLDPTRSVTSAVSLGDVYTGINSVVDVRGWNYHLGPGTDDYHREHPDQPNLGTEQASTVTTRGVYANDPEHCYVSAYDGKPVYGQSAEDWWMFFAQRPWLSGGFVWTGFDYRGEPTPYQWPCINSHFGIVDTCGFPKDNFYYYQAWWTTNVVLHLLPHWNWPGREGQEIRVDALSNCKTVELFLNGESLGRQQMNPNSKLSWQVKYQAGVLSARGYDAAGKLLKETKVETTGQPASIQLTPERATVLADGRDVSLVTVAVCDPDGRVVPTADKLVHFRVDGPGEIIGVGNGNPSCLEPDVYADQPAPRTGTMNEWWMTSVANAEEHREVAEKFNDTRWALVDLSGDGCLVGADKSAVFRAHLFVTDTDLAATNIVLQFGTIQGNARVYIDGKFLAAVVQATGASGLNIQKLLHAGVNTVAVVLQSDAKPGGIGHGVSVKLPGTSKTAAWQRSTFNGLAMVLIRSKPQAGPIKVEATSDGLASAVTVIASRTESLHAEVVSAQP